MGGSTCLNIFSVTVRRINKWRVSRETEKVEGTCGQVVLTDQLRYDWRTT